MSTENLPTGGPLSEGSLPPLTLQEHQIFNRFAVIMEQFHENFRRYWTDLWVAATEGTRPRGMTLRQLVNQGIDFTGYLTAHHNIEERRIFPHLATRMAEFDGKKGEMPRQHKKIHAGLTKLAEYLTKVSKGEVDFEKDALKDVMEPWGKVLWEHLDGEVNALKAENMRKYWTKEEMMDMYHKYW